MNGEREKIKIGQVRWTNIKCEITTTFAQCPIKIKSLLVLE